MLNCTPRGSVLPELDRQPRQCYQDEETTHLELSQLVVETSRPVPRAELSAAAAAGLWALRAFAVLVSLLVIYAFIGQLG
jgi:hypothetical protein